MLNEALSQGASPEDVNKKIDEFNSSKFGETVLLSYDNIAKTVNVAIFLKPVEVETTKEKTDGKK